MSHHYCYGADYIYDPQDTEYVIEETEKEVLIFMENAEYLCDVVIRHQEGLLYEGEIIEVLDVNSARVYGEVTAKTIQDEASKIMDLSFDTESYTDGYEATPNKMIYVNGSPFWVEV